MKLAPHRSQALTRAVALTAALTSTLAFERPAFAGPPDSTTQTDDAVPITARVELIADSLPDATRAEVQLEVARQLTTMAGELGFAVVESEAAGLILRVELGQPDHQKPVYVVHVAAFHNGQLLERADARTCFRCTPAELVEDGLELMPRAVAKALAARPSNQDQPVPPPTIAADDDADRVVTRRMRPGPATYAGISVGGLGLACAITGGVLLERGIQPRKADPNHLTVLNHTPPGAALLGIGLGTMAAAMLLLGLDGFVLAPRRATKTRATLSHITIAANGFLLAGRF